MVHVSLAVVLLVYSAASCFLLLRDLRRQLVRHAIQDLETVEGLLSFDAQGRLTFRDDYHNHPESKQVLERLLEVRSLDGQVLLTNELLGQRSLGEGLLPREGEGGYSQREAILADGLKVQLVQPAALGLWPSDCDTSCVQRGALVAAVSVRPGCAASPLAADSCFDRHWRLLPGLKFPGADSSDGSEGGGDHK